MIDAIKKFVTNYLLAICLALAASGCLFITIRMNQRSGISQAATEEGQFLLGWAAIIVHVTSLVLCGLVAGGAAKGGYKKLAWGMGVIVACGAIFSAMNILGFLASEKLSVSKARQHLIEQRAHDADARRTAAAKRLDIQAKLAEKQLEWNKGISGKDVGRKERTEIRRDMQEASRAIIADVGKSDDVASKEAPPAVVIVDGQSELMSDMTWGLLSVKGAQTLNSVWLVMMLLVLETVLWPTSAYCWGGFNTVGPSFVTHGKAIPLGEEALVTVIPPSEPPAGPKLLAAPLVRAEPSIDARAILERIKVPAHERDQKEGRDTLGPRFLGWLTAYNLGGSYGHDKVTALYEEYCAAAGLEPWADRVAKAELAGVHRGRRYYAESSGSPVVWIIRPPSFEEMHVLLDKAGFPEAPKAGKKSNPSKQDQPSTEETAPDKGGAPAANRPFSSGAARAALPDAACREHNPAQRLKVASKPVQGWAELSRYVPDWQRTIARVEKAKWQSKAFVAKKKQLNRFSRARSAA